MVRDIGRITGFNVDAARIAGIPGAPRRSVAAGGRGKRSGVGADGRTGAASLGQKCCLQAGTPPGPSPASRAPPPSAPVIDRPVLPTRGAPRTPRRPLRNTASPRTHPHTGTLTPCHRHQVFSEAARRPAPTTRAPPHRPTGRSDHHRSI